MPDINKIEQIPVPQEVPQKLETETGVEKKVEKIVQPERPVAAEKPQITNTKTQTPTPVVAQDQNQIILHKVESILSEGMENVYLSMDAGTQAIFKAKGEETSQKIASLFQKTKVQLRQVIGLIVDWLRVIPKINKFYIEQEAKIKADAIMDLYKKK